MQKATGCHLLSLINMVISLRPLAVKFLPRNRVDLTVRNSPTGINPDVAMMLPITGKAAHPALFRRLISLAQHAKK